MAGLTLDTGALVAADRSDRAFWALWQRRVRAGVDATVPATVVAQGWRGSRNAQMALLLRACVVEPLDYAMAREVGALLAVSRTADIVDASVVVSASTRGDAILTTDPADIARLAGFRRNVGPVIRV